MSEIDLTLALQLQAQFEEELRVSLLEQQGKENRQQNEGTPLFRESHGKKNTRKPLEESHQEKLSISLTDPTWEMIDPNPDIHTLFLTFNDQFFWGRLTGVEVRWSPRMKLCAGVCSYEGRGGLCSVRLSLPLLKLRPRKDLVETLLHEMIHAYLFVTANNRDRDGHGPEFHKHMYRINGVAGTKISVYHTFHDEVDVYRQHIWQCNGPCRTRQPYFGLLKRSMNRAPGPNDNWWAQHQQTCGGTYIKIKEPDRSKATKKESNINSKTKADGRSDIRKYMGSTGKSNSIKGTTSKGVHSKDRQDPVDAARKTESGRKHSLGENEDKPNKVRGFASTSSGGVNQVKVSGASHSNIHGFGGHSPAQKKPCPRNGVAAGKMSGSKNAVKGNNGSSGMTGLAVRGSGSQTVTVKGKTATQTGTKVKESTTNNKESSNETCYTTFQGHGHTLGGGNTSRVSKLLSLSTSSQSRNSKRPSTSLKTKTESGVNSDAMINRRDSTSSSPVSSPEGNTTRKRQKSLDCYVISPSSSSEPIRKTIQCPVCDATVPEREINKHLDQCVGNLSDDEMKDETKEAPCEAMPSASGGGLSGVDKDKESEQYPCPVCGECCSPETINQHLDSHF